VIDSQGQGLQVASSVPSYICFDKPLRSSLGLATMAMVTVFGLKKLTPPSRTTPCSSPVLVRVSAKDVVDTATSLTPWFEVLEPVAKLLNSGNSDKKKLQPEVLVDFQAPPLGVKKWKPGQHGSFKSFLAEQSKLDDYDLEKAVITAEFDFNHRRTEMRDAADLARYLNLSDRGRLYVAVKKEREQSLSLKDVVSGIVPFSKQVGTKVVDAVRSWVVASNISEDKVKEEEDVLRDLTSCSEFKIDGDVKMYSDVPLSDWDELVGSLQKDEYPSKLISAFKRCKLAGATEETPFALKYTDGKLEHAYLVRLTTQREGDMMKKALLMYYQISFLGGNGSSAMEKAMEATISAQVALSIQRYTEKASLHFWKAKLEAGSSSNSSNSTLSLLEDED